MSVEQIEANRRNALESTGPRTAGGKAVSRMNAVKHGILAREVVLRGEHDGERRREFETLCRRFWEHFAPVGPMEEMLVERIVTAYWRLHRVLIAERGAIARNLDGAQQRAKLAEPNRLWLLVTGGEAESSGAGLLYLMHVLKGVRESIQKEGELTGAMVQRTAVAFGGQPNVVTAGLQKIWETARSNTEGTSAGESAADGSVEALKVERRELALRFIDDELARCERNLLAAEEREKNEAQIRRDASFLPGQPVLEKILRYEASLERQLYRAVNQLERQQRARKGETIPPPLTMDVSGG
jgi:hypothetical protein